MNSHKTRLLDEDVLLRRNMKNWAQSLKAPPGARRALLAQAAENGRKQRNLLGLTHWILATSRDTISLYSPGHADETIGWMFGRTFAFSVPLTQGELKDLV